MPRYELQVSITFEGPLRIEAANEDEAKKKVYALDALECHAPSFLEADTSGVSWETTRIYGVTEDD